MARRPVGRDRSLPLRGGAEPMPDKYKNHPAQHPSGDGGHAPQAGSLAGKKDMNTNAAHGGMAGSQIASDATTGGSGAQMDSDMSIGNAPNTPSGLGPDSRSIASPSVMGQGSARPDAVTRNANQSGDPSIRGHVFGGKFRKVGR